MHLAQWYLQLPQHCLYPHYLPGQSLSQSRYADRQSTLEVYCLQGSRCHHHYWLPGSSHHLQSPQLSLSGRSLYRLMQVCCHWLMLLLLQLLGQLHLLHLCQVMTGYPLGQSLSLLLFDHQSGHLGLVLSTYHPGLQLQSLLYHPGSSR
ncbi:Uncharacterised protein [Acinetobacter nosocomialis]|nr:Uncharacterised protein [Acinetobacter nosocomialis]